MKVLQIDFLLGLNKGNNIFYHLYRIFILEQYDISVTTGFIELKITGKDTGYGKENSLAIWMLLAIIILFLICILLVIFHKQRGNFNVTDVFIIHKNGILIKYLGNTLKTNSDEDIISGMLTAVQSFISDSFAGNSKDGKDDWKLNQLKMGKHEIMIERGNDIFLTVIYKLL